MDLLRKLNENFEDDFSIVINNETMSLYEYDFVFAKKLWRLYDPFVENLDEIVSGNTNKAIIISKTNKASEQYFFPTISRNK